MDGFLLLNELMLAVIHRQGDSRTQSAAFIMSVSVEVNDTKWSLNNEGYCFDRVVAGIFYHTLHIQLCHT